MLIMQRYLILIALAGAALAQAEGSVPVVRQVSDARTVATPAAAKPAARQLSAEERAELRRQLYQYSRLHGKGS